MFGFFLHFEIVNLQFSVVVFLQFTLHLKIRNNKQKLVEKLINLKKGNKKILQYYSTTQKMEPKFWTNA